MGQVYVLHLDRPLEHARHYVGWASNLEARLAHHAAGTGARLLQVCRERGIGWKLAAAMPGTRSDERRMKRNRWATRWCPECGLRLKKGEG
jgi:predicted GIY-YIG superfamily endonuclease